MPTYSPHRQHPSLVALGNAIRSARLAQDLSQEQLALKAEVDRTYLGRVERGDSVVAVLVLISIAKALGLSLERLCKDANL